MFQAEQRGLQALAETSTIAVPHVHWVDSFEGEAFLLMDHVESKRPDAVDYRRLGTRLAELHHSERPICGFEADNFIGSLPQSNKKHEDWSVFYWSERILPQLRLSLQKGYLTSNRIPSPEKATALFSRVFGKVTPVMLHGDLWGGNYLIAKDGTPYLIDPAAYYGHAMVDIAMSRLFGGFGPTFYEAYHEHIPITGDYSAQIDLYQLYYLLVHLNLFGSGYYGSVDSILNLYF